MSISSVENKFNFNLRELIKKKWEEREFFYSFELVSCQDKTVYQKFFYEIKDCFPLFYALTWHKNFNINNFDDNLSHMPGNTLLHVTARGKTENDVRKILDRALELGIFNIFVLRGDNCECTGDFLYAVDLVKFIKKYYNDKFSIAVAGYPERHPESVSKESEFLYLKEKIDAGADFIITQIIFDGKLFIKFVEDCRKNEINVPIVAGMMPIINFSSLIKVMSVCGLVLPQTIYKTLEEIKEDDIRVQEYGITLLIEIITEIMDNGFYGFHFFTFNKSKIILQVLDKLNSFKKLNEKIKNSRGLE